jgi:predicted nucleic-acid-binding protein
VIGLDTNVLLRWMLEDVPVQTRVAARQMDRLTLERPGFVSQTVMLELFYVLTKVEGLTKLAAMDVLEKLLRTEVLEFDDGESVWDAIVMARAGADFPDALVTLTGRLYGCDETVTFDRGAARHAGMQLLS